MDKQKRNFNYKSVSGQSTVEYLLLLVVIMSLVVTVFRSDAFNQFFAEDSAFFAKIERLIEYSYRHGVPGGDDTVNYSGTGHPSFYGGGGTRFFIGRESYGGQ